MKKLLAVLVLLSAPAAAQQVPANKQLIVDFFAFRGTRQERADKFLAPDYVQHNPRFLKMDLTTGARGRQAWVAAFDEAQRLGRLQLVALGGIALRDPIILIAEGDLAFAVYRGSLPERDSPARRYDAFAFEAFRIRNGQFTEHWDQVRLRPGWMTPQPAPAPPAANAGGAARGGGAPAAPAPAVVPEPAAGCTASPATIAANKALVTGLSRASRRGLTRDLLIAECDFVAEVWKQVLPDPDDAARTWEAFTFDAYRIRDGRIVEHWDEAVR
jgi:predicted SnoaL-like aldol condensation-catalyzing enzyme